MTIPTSAILNTWRHIGIYENPEEEETESDDLDYEYLDFDIIGLAKSATESDEESSVD